MPPRFREPSLGLSHTASIANADSWRTAPGVCCFCTHRHREGEWQGAGRGTPEVRSEPLSMPFAPGGGFYRSTTSNHPLRRLRPLLPLLNLCSFRLASNIIYRSLGRCDNFTAKRNEFVPLSAYRSPSTMPIRVTPVRFEFCEELH